MSDENPLEKLREFVEGWTGSTRGRDKVYSYVTENFIPRSEAIPMSKFKEEAGLCLNRTNMLTGDFRCEWGQCGFCGVPELMWKLKTGEMHMKLSKSEILKKLRDE